MKMQPRFLYKLIKKFPNVPQFFQNYTAQVLYLEHFLLFVRLVYQSYHSYHSS